jgi:hypothetical protein
MRNGLTLSGLSRYFILGKNLSLSRTERYYIISMNAPNLYLKSFHLTKINLVAMKRKYQQDQHRRGSTYQFCPVHTELIREWLNGTGLGRLDHLEPAPMKDGYIVYYKEYSKGESQSAISFAKKYPWYSWVQDFKLV